VFIDQLMLWFNFLYGNSALYDRFSPEISSFFHIALDRFNVDFKLSYRFYTHFILHYELARLLLILLMSKPVIQNTTARQGIQGDLKNA
jgi:hypothetical protein